MKDNNTIIAVSIIIGSIIIAISIGIKKSPEEICYDKMYKRMLKWNEVNTYSYRDPVINSVEYCFKQG